MLDDTSQLVTSTPAQSGNAFNFNVDNASNFNPTPTTPAALFGGKTARELLTAFYQEKNPSKISDVDNVLLKYQVWTTMLHVLLLTMNALANHILLQMLEF